MTEKKTRNAFSEYLFEYKDVQQKKLILSLSITTVVMFVELIGGFLTNSIALLSDAGHMFTHSFAITIGLIAIIIAKKPPCHHRTFGLYRAEVLAAFINGLFLLLVAVIIIYEAYLRIINPLEILGFQMLYIAFIGLGTNIASILILRGSHHGNVNIKGVFFHMIADAVSSVGIILAAVIIIYSGWNFVDPLVSIGISLLIIYWAWGILKESTRILLETAPEGIDIDIISKDLKNQFPEIKSLNNVHLWTIIPEMIVFSAHMTLNNIKNIEKEKLVEKINSYLAKKYNIIEATIQITSDDNSNICNI
jgi:cobalt-zinc-cadmium efflux system protein